MNIGIDIGYSAVKAASGQKRVIFPSVVGTPDKARFSLNGSQTLIMAAPEHVAVGEGAIQQSRFVHRREDRAWIEGPEWYMLALAALTELTEATVAELRLVTGLPVAFYDDRQAVRDRLLGEHKAQREGRRAQKFTVGDCRVVPQPFGCLLAATLDDRGRIVNEALATGAVGIIDIGGKTTNMLSVNKLSEIGTETDSANVGAWDAVRAVRSWLATNCPDLDLRDHQIVDAIIARSLKYYGEKLDLSAIVGETLDKLGNEIVAVATQLWNGGASLDAILISGGGALLLGPHISRKFRHAKVVEEPVFSNATGFWRFAQRLASE